MESSDTVTLLYICKKYHNSDFYQYHTVTLKDTPSLFPQTAPPPPPPPISPPLTVGGINGGIKLDNQNRTFDPAVLSISFPSPHILLGSLKSVFAKAAKLSNSHSGTSPQITSWSIFKTGTLIGCRPPQHHPTPPLQPLPARDGVKRARGGTH